MGEEKSKSAKNKPNFSKGEYEIFEVGKELVLSNDRDKIKDYAKKKNVKEIIYRMSVHNKKNLDVTDL